MRTVEPPEGCRPEPGDGVQVGLHLKLRRGGRDREVVAARDDHARDVAGEANIAPTAEGVMVTRMTRRVPGFDLDLATRMRSPSLSAVTCSVGAGKMSPHQRGHSVAVNTGGTVDKPAWLDEMRSAFGMNEDLGTLLSPPPSGPRVIEMDVGHEDFGDVLGHQSRAIQSRQ